MSIIAQFLKTNLYRQKNTGLQIATRKLYTYSNDANIVQKCGALTYLWNIKAGKVNMVILDSCIHIYQKYICIRYDSRSTNLGIQEIACCLFLKNHLKSDFEPNSSRMLEKCNSIYYLGSWFPSWTKILGLFSTDTWEGFSVIYPDC